MSRLLKQDLGPPPENAKPELETRTTRRVDCLDDGPISTAAPHSCPATVCAWHVLLSRLRSWPSGYVGMLYPGRRPHVPSRLLHQARQD